jgi:hypothetical protein
MKKQLLTTEELETIKMHAEWHGNNLGYRDLGNFMSTPLLHLLIEDYERLLSASK